MCLSVRSRALGGGVLGEQLAEELLGPGGRDLAALEGAVRGAVDGVGGDAVREVRGARLEGREPELGAEAAVPGADLDV